MEFHHYCIGSDAQLERQIPVSVYDIREGLVKVVCPFFAAGKCLATNYEAGESLQREKESIRRNPTAPTRYSNCLYTSDISS